MYPTIAQASPGKQNQSLAPSCTIPSVTGGSSCDTGSSVLSPQDQKHQKRLDEKNALAQDFSLVRLGKLDMQTFLTRWHTFIQQYARPTSVMANLARGQVSATTSVNPYTCVDGTCPPVSASLNTPQAAQQTTYYCGPATAYEMLKGMGKTTGPHGEVLSQSVLAGSSYLQTNALGQTPWSGPYVMGPSLNAWAGQSFYAAQYAPSLTTYIADVTVDIYLGWPVAANVVEEANNTVHLVGHPTNQTIYHWVAIKGYNTNGNNTTYVDSVHGTTFWSWSPNVPAQSTIPSNNMYIMVNGKNASGQSVDPRGIVE
jgi:hypothetical protein